MQKIKKEVQKITRSQNAHEKRVCIKCGRELPLKDFYRTRNTNNIKYVKTWCKECHSQYRKNRHNQIKIREYIKDESMQKCMKYKTIIPQKVFDAGKYGIWKVANDEIFVKLMDYRDCYISNYGRLVEKKGNNKYSLKRKNVMFENLFMSVFKCSARWCFRFSNLDFDAFL